MELTEHPQKGRSGALGVLYCIPRGDFSLAAGDVWAAATAAPGGSGTSVDPLQQGDSTSLNKKSVWLQVLF